MLGGAVGEVVVNGARLPIRNSVLAELARTAAALTPDGSDQALLTSTTAQISLSLDGLAPEQASRIARAMVVAAEEVRRPYSVAGAPAGDVETAAQLAAIGIVLSRSFGLS